jgi:hypothetical protein
MTVYIEEIPLLKEFFRAIARFWRRVKNQHYVRSYRFWIREPTSSFRWHDLEGYEWRKQEWGVFLGEFRQKDLFA